MFSRTTTSWDIMPPPSCSEPCGVTSYGSMSYPFIIYILLSLLWSLFLTQYFTHSKTFDNTRKFCLRARNILFILLESPFSKTFQLFYSVALYTTKADFLFFCRSISAEQLGDSCTMVSSGAIEMPVAC